MSVLTPWGSWWRMTEAEVVFVRLEHEALQSYSRALHHFATWDDLDRAAMTPNHLGRHSLQFLPDDLPPRGEVEEAIAKFALLKPVDWWRREP